MANQIGPRHPDPGSQARTIGEHGRAIAQLQRLMTNLPKPAPAAAGGGIIGTTWATATGTIHDLGSYSSLQGFSWAFSPPNTIGTAPTFTVNPTDDAALLPTVAGWYSARLHVVLAWLSSPPAVVQLTAFCGQSTAFETVEQRAGGGWADWDPVRTGCSASVPVGPTYVGEYEGDNIGLSIEWPGTTATLYQATVRLEIAHHSGA